MEWRGHCCRACVLVSRNQHQTAASNKQSDCVAQTGSRTKPSLKRSPSCKGFYTQTKNFLLFFMLKSLLFAPWKCADLDITNEACVFKSLWLLNSIN